MEVVKFNIKNIKFATKSSEEDYSKPVAYGYARAISLEADTSMKSIYGDGIKIATIVNDKGKKGSFTTNAISALYEIAMGRKLQTPQGIVDIKQTKNVDHAIYFETDYIEDGVTKTLKTWLLGVVSSRPSEAYDQTEDDTSESTFETPIEIKGVKMKYDNGDDYRDENGNEVYAWQISATSEDEDFETFENAVVVPAIPSV